MSIGFSTFLCEEVEVGSEIADFVFLHRNVEKPILILDILDDGFRSGASPEYSDKTWKILEHGIQQIFNYNASGLNLEELYRNAYNMVVYKFVEKLYSGLVATVTSHLKYWHSNVHGHDLYSKKKMPICELGLKLWTENVIYSNQIRT
ncbi:hypothetical protein P8452_42771 [Trifolium repens]|nr:hypothetical protein P8452_42771 [Trifolium repens]